MKKLVLSFVAVTALTSTASAFEQKDLSLAPECKAAIVKKVMNKFGDDETFSIVGLKLLYGGKSRGFSLTSVVLVKTSDEVEPRDMLAIASSTREANGTDGCKVESLKTIADGSTLEVSAEEMDTEI